ncbi:MAG TPA: hypothetical protein VF657_08835 [Actinoplanes sp.]
MDLGRDLQRLREQAYTDVGRRSGRIPLRSAIFHITRGRIDRRPRYTVGQLPNLPTPWQDTVSGRYFGWRCRQANLHGGQAFVVEYVICPYCRIGWVDKPHTTEPYQRYGLAAAGLRSLQVEHPTVVWHTGSGHMRLSKPFWAAVGASVPGGYTPRDLCAHVVRQGGLLPRWLLNRG